ncbi:MAG: leucyl aminopeptidase family protein [Bacteroidales bacterium]|jgi:leucyl aminopeptidase|nr:leucyl aminopeptidase family protein [Bacteroidales bacterium]
MIQLTIHKDTPQNNNIILLSDPTCPFIRYGLNEEEDAYVRQQIANKAKQVAINKNGYWIFIQIMDEKTALNKEKENMRRGASKIHGWICQQNIRSITVVDTVNNDKMAYAFVEGLVLTNYQFLKYVKKKEEKQYSLSEVFVVGDSIKQDEVDILNNILFSVYKTRDLINEPANILNSVQLAHEIKSMADGSGLKVQVLDKSEIEKLKMGGILSVNKGSVEEPTFSIIEWKPENAHNKQPVVLVGKGLVYDTGGLSLKPTTNSMDYMKCDMSGGAAVAATLYAVARSNLPVYVIGLVPSTDNRISASAYAPGDIITMYDGTTVEVMNTDAEGRLILADALSYAKKYNPELVIDMATLTGAAHRAIGEQAMVGMGNASRETMEKLKECGESVFERIAEFPFWDEYVEFIKSDIADLKNIGGEYAGAITAGKFLEFFTDYPYIHLDIAGPAYIKTTDAYRTKGGTGIGVRLLFEFLRKL